MLKAHGFTKYLEQKSFGDLITADLKSLGKLLKNKRFSCEWTGPIVVPALPRGDTSSKVQQVAPVEFLSLCELRKERLVARSAKMVDGLYGQFGGRRSFNLGKRSSWSSGTSSSSSSTKQWFRKAFNVVTHFSKDPNWDAKGTTLQGLHAGNSQTTTYAAQKNW